MAMMNQFGSTTVVTMRSVFDEVCRQIPADSTSARVFVASQILQCASTGEHSYDGLLAAGRRAVIEQFGGADAAREGLRRQRNIRQWPASTAEELPHSRRASL
jgi:hypothetical protein